MLRTRRRSVSTLTALAVAGWLALTACSDSGSDDGSGDGPGGAAGAGESPAVADPPPADAVADGCTLVPAELLQDTLDLDPGEATPVPSAVDGPDSCEYDALFGTVQVSTDAETYFTGKIYEPDAVPGAVDAPAPADRGYVAVGGFLVVRGETGVLFTAGDPRDSTLEQWTALAAEVVGQLP
jgi:hypothetical protein